MDTQQRNGGEHEGLSVSYFMESQIAYLQTAHSVYRESGLRQEAIDLKQLIIQLKEKLARIDENRPPNISYRPYMERDVVRRDSAEQQAAAPSTELTRSQRLWNAVAQTLQQAEENNLPILGTNKKIRERRQIALRAFLVENASFAEISHEIGLTSPSGAYTLVQRSIENVFPYLPEELQQEYGTPENAFKAQTSEGLTKANLRRWQHYREVLKPQGIPAFSEQGLANIKERSGRWRSSRVQAEESTEPPEPSS